MGNLEQAIGLATRVHAGQVDAVGAPYILHPLRVMFRLDSDLDRIVGVLHDVIEDSTHTLADLAALGFTDEVIAAVDCVSRRAGETYAEFLDRVETNPVAIRVKLADLEDNLDVRRLPTVTERDQVRLNRYLEARIRLRCRLDVAAPARRGSR